MAQQPLKNVLRLVAEASPELLSEAQARIFPQLYDIGPTDAEVDQVLTRLSQRTGAGKQPLQRDWKAYKTLREDEARPAGKYHEIDGALHAMGSQGLYPLCNFSARIVQEILLDDGLEERRMLQIEGSLNDGTRLPRIEIPATQFGSMNWVMERWGSRAVIHPGQANKDNLRAAMQLLGDKVPVEHVYSHTGWRCIDGEWVYLHAGGAIGANGARKDILTALGGKLEHFVLPELPDGEELKQAVRASLDLLKLGPKQVMIPLLAGVYRSVLGEAKSADFAQFLTGRTGSFKSEVTALVQAHFGAGFSRENLPANFSSTGNALEKIAFLVKDAVLVVDEYTPTGTRQDMDRLHKTAEQLFRAQGNQGGRGRMNAGGTLRPTYYPRGIVIASGEDVPPGHSLQARMMILELAPGDITPADLSQAQAAATLGLYAQAMAGYIRYLAPRMGELSSRIAEKQRRYRDGLGAQLRHRRTLDQVASLLVGYGTLLEFAVETGTLTEQEASDYLAEAQQVLLDVAAHQDTFHLSADPVERYIELLKSALATGKAHLSDPDNEAPPSAEHLGWQRKVSDGMYPITYLPLGEHVGWVEGDDVYLDPNAAYACVSKYAGSQGITLSMSKDTLQKRLAERGLLVSQDKRRNTTRKVFGGTRHTVLHLRLDLLLSEIEPIVPAPANTVGNGNPDAEAETGTVPEGVQDIDNDDLEAQKAAEVARLLERF